MAKQDQSGEERETSPSGTAAPTDPPAMVSESTRESRLQTVLAKQQQHQQQQTHTIPMGTLTQKSVIIHKDESGFGLRIKGQSPVSIEHVHEYGAAWRAGVRTGDHLCKVNGVPVSQLDHKEVVLLFKSCSRFVALTLISPFPDGTDRTAATVASELLDANARLPHPQAGALQSTGPETATAALVAAHLANRRMSGATASTFVPSPLMDRTNSCRSTAGLLSGSRLGVGAIKQQQQLSQTKLSRQDSSEAETADKRLAICICCRNSIETEPGLAQPHRRQQQQHQHQHQDQQQTNPTITICSQCQLRYQRTSHELAHRQMHSGSLRDPAAHAGRLARAAPTPIGGANSHAAPDKPTGTATVITNASASGNGGIKLPSSASIKSLPTQTSINPERGGSGAGRETGIAASALKPRAACSAKPIQVNKRIEIIREFIDTERTHTERLRCLNELFYRPLKETGLVNPEQLRMVFSSHRTLYKIHKQIYRILMSANFDVYSEPLVGSALLEIFEGDLKRRLERASCSFCSAQATNTELLNKLTRRDTKAGEFLAQITSQRMVGRLGIKDLLASCFQRLTKYPLLLENLLKATPESLPQDEDEDDPVGNGGQPHRRRSKSGLSAHQRRVRMRAGLSDDADALGPGGPDDDDEANESDSDDRDYRDTEDYELETEDDDEDEEARQARVGAAEEARRNSRRIMAISLAEEREFIERALTQSRQILVRVNESIRVAIARQRLKEIWKRTDKYPGVPLPNIAKQQVVHEGLLTLRLVKRSFDVYVLLLNDYIIILTREGQDKYRLKFFTPEGKSAASSLVSSANSASVSSFMGGGAPIYGSNNGAGNLAPGANFQNNSGTTNNVIMPLQTVYSPVFVIDEHLTTRDAATDENGFYLLCKRKDDSRIYEFASRSPAERMKWRDKIQWTIERQIGRSHRRPSCESTLTKSSSEISANGAASGSGTKGHPQTDPTGSSSVAKASDERQPDGADKSSGRLQVRARTTNSRPSTPSAELTKIVGTISYVIDDGIVMPSKMESSRVFVDQAIQVNILDGSTSIMKTGHHAATVVGHASSAQ